MIVHIGFVDDLFMSVTTDENISNQLVAKMTMHIGLVDLYTKVLILMSLIRKKLPCKQDF